LNGSLPWVAWVGRPAVHDGVDASGLDGFVAGAAVLRGRAHLVLVGERLSTAAAALRAAGVDCRVHGLREFSMASASEWLSRFDAVAIGGGPDAGPWPLFDALHAGVPVAATRHGWCEALLADGQCGRLVDDACLLGEALLSLVADRPAWREAAPQLAASVKDRSLAAWALGELQLAARLAGFSARSAA
jgi:glycosyltransferase involved in cell wall biosynthesis